MPRFSVIVPCFNAAATLADTLQALRDQHLQDWEALLIDDGSTDATVAILEAAAAADSRFRVLQNIGKGPSAARNLGLAEALGEIVAFCDADDIWEAEKLACLARTFDADGVDGCYARIAFFDGDQSRTTSQIAAGDLTIPVLLGENPVCTMSNLALKREVALASGGLDESMVHNEVLEWLIWLVGEGHRITGIDRVLVRYRTSVTGLSSDLSAMQAGRETALRTAERFGFTSEPKADAIHLRYLARRALRVGAPPKVALGLALQGLRLSPRGWFSNARRGALVLGGVIAAPLMPMALRRVLLSY